MLFERGSSGFSHVLGCSEGVGGILSYNILWPLERELLVVKLYERSMSTQKKKKKHKGTSIQKAKTRLRGPQGLSFLHMTVYESKTPVTVPLSKMVDQVATNHESLDKWCFLLSLFFVC